MTDFWGEWDVMGEGRMGVLLSPPSPSVPLKGTGGPMPVYDMSAREVLREDGRGCEVFEVALAGFCC